MRISDWSSDVCSSDLYEPAQIQEATKTATAAAAQMESADGCKPRVDLENGVVYPTSKIFTVQDGPVTEEDRQSVVSGKSVSVRLDLCRRRIIKTLTYISNIVLYHSSFSHSFFH